jgi:hypothetical protein
MMSGAPLRLRDSITLAAVAALAAATVHVGALAVDWFAGRMAGYAREFSWISPLGYLIWLGPLALLLWALGTRWRALASARVQVSVLGALGPAAHRRTAPAVAARPCRRHGLGAGVARGA